ncbi:protein TolR [Pseudomonadales bacterium]|jgi:biopolymer transport protein TolR|nr:protein TolR [Pseudomonadales bacterium]MDB4420803.1 protein TolR [Pseudomonadales bacterium]MDB4431629.1 protein TolR [Pseudomonadales bacterium]MDB4529175.1 protein TolR [Pseudomonadales bacterium]MDB4542099.1 protein TolR [Pseudomonadales bacterium]
MQGQSRYKKRRKLIAEINVVPYIDVTLVLLIVFMVTAPLLMQGVEVELPQAPSTPIDAVKDEPLIVSIKADGSLYLNLGAKPDSPVTLASVTDRVAKVLVQKPETAVLVWGDKNIPYGEVVSLMTSLQGAGAPAVGLVTETP